MRRYDCRFHFRQLRGPQLDTSTVGNLVFSGPHRNRLFSNLGFFVQKALMTFQVEHANWTELSQSLTILVKVISKVKYLTNVDHLFESRQAIYGRLQVGADNKRNAELVSHVFRSQTENPS